MQQMTEQNRGFSCEASGGDWGGGGVKAVGPSWVISLQNALGRRAS